MTANTQELVIYTFTQAPWFVRAHLAVAVAALVLGMLVLLRRKGTVSHKLIGWSWVVLMLSASITSLLIQARGRFSAIHVLSVAVLIFLPLGVMFIRKRNVRGHKITMVATFAGLGIAGAFTLLPYRMLGQLAFGSQ
ncbi:DUF2306 domain-containing protein [Variovorax sp. J22R133]|uniref:DUF2306 domain-containing protein n=1 Tax=Variovorax brevis TaxID=3053503 RepID=UPI002574F115|nr:DUF2306 domain-containing protein [Variovorax sp. J22R133]MDM0115581.1 DUF2306 domain-containing protein [Variovorax sp. J22R133]